MKKIVKKFFLILNFLAVLLLLLSYLAPVVNPEKFVIPSYLGLIFPYIVLLNLLFVIGWVMASKWYFIISIFFLLTGYKVLNRAIPYRTNATELTAPGSVKIMSYNVRVFNRYGWKDKGSAVDVAEFIRSENPDILCIQEFAKNEKKKDL